MNLHPCTGHREPSDMPLGDIERELASYDKIPIDKLTPNMIDRINRLRYAQKKVRYGRLW